MKIGLLRHMTVMRCPMLRGEMSTSTEDSARTSADGLRLSIRGQHTVAPPTVSIALLVRLRKSRLPDGLLVWGMATLSVFEDMPSVFG